MALIGNRSVILKSPGRNLSGTVASGDRNNFRPNRNAYEQLDPLASLPDGANAPVAWQLPVTAGGMSSNCDAGLYVTTTAGGTMGLPAFGDTTINVSIANAAGQLISSGTGSSAITVSTNSPLLTASMSGTGSAAIYISPNTPTLGAVASVIGSTSIAMSGTLIPYAIGSMSGTTSDSGTLTPQAISAAVWEYVDRTLTAASSSSLTTEEHDQLMKTLTTAKFLGLK